MTETKPKRRWFSFSIRELLLLTALLGMGIAWWLDHQRLTTISDVPAKLVDDALAKDTLIAQMRRAIDVLKAKVIYPDSKEQLSAAQIQDRIQAREKQLKMREDELRPIVTRRLLGDFEYWLESRTEAKP